ncbi:hypothetical protein LZP73_01525 [Shewanella sp. AS16]|uniref:hypothetical protein n=1 Tax=Shewanella sp. AS16 TaxID=2907625 RepID=UPI001F1E5B08|nr:hypothetical protein [Shewanella sp. AS16]MCE9684890.1 hypothetical protein [Shewanella sp. AS16]
MSTKVNVRVLPDGSNVKEETIHLRNGKRVTIQVCLDSKYDRNVSSHVKDSLKNLKTRLKKNENYQHNLALQTEASHVKPNIQKNKKKTQEELQEKYQKFSNT